MLNSNIIDFKEIPLLNLEEVEKWVLNKKS
jgi:hypothetical protein